MTDHVPVDLDALEQFVATHKPGGPHVIEDTVLALIARCRDAEAENRRLRHDGIICEPCGRDDHQACTGDCSSACCVIYDLEADNERLRALLAEALIALEGSNAWEHPVCTRIDAALAGDVPDENGET